MEKEEFLESGLIESYVLGLTNAEESVFVEDMLAKYPDLYAEKESIEAALENIAVENGIAPGDHIINNLTNQLFPKEEVKTEFKEEKAEPRIIPIQSQSPGFWKPLSIAASIGLLLVGAWATKLRQENSSLLEESKIANVEQVFLNRKIGELTQRQLQANTFTQSIAQAGTRQIILASTQQKPTKAIVFWNPENHTVWLVDTDLPLLPADKQYQLWGIVGGKPTDAGVFDANGGKAIAVELKAVAKPQAFAVTIEKRGGSVNPTLSTLCLQAAL